MNGADRKYFEGKFLSLDERMGTIHDDVLVIKTERKTERGFIAFLAAGIALAISIIVGTFWR